LIHRKDCRGRIYATRLGGFRFIGTPTFGNFRERLVRKNGKFG